MAGYGSGIAYEAFTYENYKEAIAKETKTTAQALIGYLV